MPADQAEDEPGQDLAWRWHDNLIYGIGFEIGDPEKSDWRSDLVFDIDFIVEWRREESDTFRFLVAPARLVFHDAGDLSISIDHGDSAGRVAMNELSIGSVAREPIVHPVEMWRWTILLNAPQGGRISFCASGFTETLLDAPSLQDQQHLPRGGPGWRQKFAPGSPPGAGQA